MTQSLRDALESSGLRGFTFVPMVNFTSWSSELEWSAWDVTEDETPEYPDSGEPEDLILTRPHSEPAARALGNLWELEPANADVVSEAGTKWFERHGGDCVSITERA